MARHNRIDISVVCPFYNEAEILDRAICILYEKLQKLKISWELILIDDGSTDGSRDIVKKLSPKCPQLKLISYAYNKGRGYALRQGINHAIGDVIITTEIDLSWGEDIVERLYAAMNHHPDTDIIVASPHLEGGGYRNVPFKRVFMSRFGNLVIRLFMSNSVTMNTGMTRAYRWEVIQSIPLEENRKEFHLEVIMKAQALKYKIEEIPCILEWQTYKHKGKKVERKSSSKIKKLVVSHSLFSLFANPIRYVWGASLLSMLASLAMLVWSFFRLYSGLVSVYTLIISLSFALIAIILFASGLITQQNNMIQREIWTLKQSFKQLNQSAFKEIDKSL